MLKKWKTKNYDIELVLKVFDSIDIDFDSMDIPIRSKNLNVLIVITNR